MNAPLDLGFDAELFDPVRLDTGEALPRTAYRETLKHAQQ